MPSSVPDEWDMENNPNQNPQQKRKSNSPIMDNPIKKKTPKVPTTSKSPTPTKPPTTTDSDGALSAATRATEYACELV